MIIDVHVHLYDDGWIPVPFLQGLGRVVASSMAKTTGEFPDPGPIVAAAVEQLKDPSGDALVADMDGAGVDVSIVFPVDYALAVDEPSSGTPQCVPIAEQNRLFSEIAKKHAKRLIHFVGVDPRRKDAVALLEKGVTEQGARGLKLHPTAGFYPDDPVCHPVYAKAQELGVPVLLHTGTQPAPMKAKYSRPIFVDSVAAEFPDLKIIMAHVGHCWWEEALALAGTKWNLYVDFSGWQRVFVLHPNKFYEMLRIALDEIGPWRVMYGTDNPYLNLVLPAKQWINGVRAATTCKEFTFSGEEIDIVLGQAAAKLLGIES